MYQSIYKLIIMITIDNTGASFGNIFLINNLNFPKE